jgi:hypothetical protein
VGQQGTMRLRLGNDRTVPLRLFLEPTGFVVTIPPGATYDFDLWLEPPDAPLRISLSDTAGDLGPVAQARWSSGGQRLGQWP